MCSGRKKFLFESKDTQKSEGNFYLELKYNLFEDCFLWRKIIMA
jgi:hypothetical protein